MRAFLRVDGVPQSKQRPRHMKNGHTYTPKETIEAEQNIRVQYLMQDCPKFAKKTTAPCNFVLYAYSS